MSYTPGLNGGRINLTLGGNSTSAGAGYALASTGTLTLAGGNNITLSQNGNAVTISAGAGGGGVMLSGSNNSITSGTASFVNANGMSWSFNGQSISGSVNTSYLGSNASTNYVQANAGFNGTNASGTIASNAVSVSVAAQSVQPAVVISGSNNSITSGTASFVNANGVSWSFNGQSISASISQGGVANAAGTQTATSGTVNFANSNGISFGMSGSSQITASYTVPSQTVQTQNMFVVNDGANSITSGTVVLSDLNGVSFGINGQTITGSVAAQTVQPGIQSIMVSNTTYTTGNVSFSNANGISFGSSAGGGAITASYTVPAAQTVQTQNMAVLSGGGGSVSSGTASFVNANGMSWSFNGQSISGSVNTSYLGSNASTNYVQANAGFNGTNASGTIASNAVSVSVANMFNAGVSTSGSAGNTGTMSNQLVFAGGNNITLSQSTYIGGASVIVSAPNFGTAAAAMAQQFAGNTAGGANSTITSGTLQWAGGNGITLSQTSNSVTIMAGGFTASSTVLGMQQAFAQSSTSLGQNTVYIFPEIINDYVSASVIKMPVLITNSSSAAASIQKGLTMDFAVYTRHSTNSTVLTRHYSTSYTMAASHNSNVSWAQSMITAIGNSTSYNSITASSLGINLSSSMHGARELILPFNTVLAPGEYWFAVRNSSSTAGAAGSVLNMSHVIASSVTGNRLGVINNATNNGLAQNMGYGFYSAATAAMPAGISMTQINQSAINPIIYMLSVTE
jgi:hypothetical protein